MATTHSQITQVSPSQSDKVTTINAGLEQLDNLLNDELDITVTADFLLTDNQQDNSFSFHLTGTPSAFTMSLNARQKLFAVRNDTGVTATIEVDPDEDGADGRTVDVEDGEFYILYCDGTNIDSLGSASGGGGSTVIDWKESVRVATTAAGTLASDFENGDTVDGITLATDDRILLQDQADASENGVYVVQASGAPTRAEDFDSTEEVTAGAITYVEEGTANGGKLFILTTTGAVTIDTTNLTFAEFSGGGGGATDFTDLGDVPSSYTGQGGKVVMVSDTEDGLEFATLGSGALSFVVAAGDEDTALVTGTGLVTFRAPYGFTIAEVRASLTTASSSGAVTVDVNKNGTSILSTKLTIDQGEKTSTTAAAAAVISDSTVADDDEFTIDIDGAGATAAGLKVTIITTSTAGSGGSGGQSLYPTFTAPAAADFTLVEASSYAGVATLTDVTNPACAFLEAEYASDSDYHVWTYLDAYDSTHTEFEWVMALSVEIANINFTHWGIHLRDTVTPLSHLFGWAGATPNATQTANSFGDGNSASGGTSNTTTVAVSRNMTGGLVFLKVSRASGSDDIIISVSKNGLSWSVMWTYDTSGGFVPDEIGLAIKLRASTTNTTTGSSFIDNSKASIAILSSVYTGTA